jgi:imidazolonepropionase-like amidohydrolase
VEKYSEYIVSADALLTEKGFVTDAAIKIKDGIITDIACSTQADHNVKVIDFSGYTVAPCFCDYHLHFFKKNTGRIKEITDDLTSYGIAKVYDGGDPHGYGMDVKKSSADRIDVHTAGHALYKQGSYGKYIGRGVGSLQEADDSIKVLYQSGADYIKVVNSGVFEPADGTISPGGFSTRELKHIVASGGAKGLHVACHANGHVAVKGAIEAGVSTLIHGLGVSDESLAVMAEKGIAFVPTVNAFAGLALKESEKKVHGNVRKAVAQHLSAVKKAYEKGVSVLPGSDSGPAVIPYGSSFHKELNLFQQAGMSIEKILLSAAAGKLERGAKADFLILDGLAVKLVCRGGFFSTPRTGT